jgi:hypothetical protein
MANIRVALAFAGLTLAAPLALAADPTEAMRTFARIFATLEARDLKGYCAAMHGAHSYVDYRTNVCQSAVQNKVKKPEECTPESVAQQIKADTDKCLAMPADEFEKTVQRGGEASKAFVKQTASESVDGEKLLREERAKLK